MKTTRNLFVLTGREQDVNLVLEQIQFKGVTILENENLCRQAVYQVFTNNKSVVCNQLFPFMESPILIKVVDYESSEWNDCINIRKGNVAEQFESIANKLNCDIGDHKSNSSGLTGAPQTGDCAYCRYLNGKNLHSDRTIYSSEHFFVIPTLGQFIPGYWLIIPYEHVMSNAELDFSTQKELLDVIEDMKYLLNLTYGCSDFLVWENGTGNSGRGKAKDSVVHAHTHIAPSCLTPQKIKELSGLYFQKIPTQELSSFNLHSYLLLKDIGDEWLISSNPNVYIPRQYIRQLLAEEYGISGEQWNWRKYPFEEQMYQSVRDMEQIILKNWNSLPSRIKTNTSKYVRNPG